jgi:hypothetical protein
MQLLLKLLRSPDHRIPTKLVAEKSTYFDKLEEQGVILHDGPYTILSVNNLSRISMVVDDGMYENFRDINWMREQRKALGLIKKEVKDEEFRRKQQARRKKRRAYAKEQRAKRLAQPSEELPMKDILL